MRESKCRRRILFIIIICLITSLFVNRYVSISEVLFKSQDVNLSKKSGLEIHIIDVGQAESILILQDDKSMLVDSGTNSSGKKIVRYLESIGVEKLDVLLITHFHIDHAGGAHSILSSIKVDKIICMKYENLSTLQEKLWYLDMSIARSVRETFKSTSIIMESAYEDNDNSILRSFNIGEAKIKILSQCNLSDIVNNKSIVFKLEYQDFSMLFMSDAEKEIEEYLLESKKDISADVLKIGHHGSRTSTTDEFLNKVNPSYAVVSCGKGNDYNHPYSSITKKLEEKDIPLYRTDELGTIVIYFQNGEISFSKEKGDYLSGKELKESEK